MKTDIPRDDLLVGDRYYILASSVAADLPKIVLKHDDAFLVADRRGNFPYLPGGEFGFYVDGTRFLRRLELRLGHQQPLLLNAAIAADSLQGVIELTNPDLLDDGRVVLPRHTLRLSRTVTLYGQQLTHTLALESFAAEPMQLAVVWEFGADFADVFEVRGFRRAQRGADLPPRCTDDTVELRYRGLDGAVRTTRLAFTPAPARVGHESAEYLLELPAAARVDISVTVTGVTEPTPAVVRAAGRRGAGAPPSEASVKILSPADATARRRQVIEALAGRAVRLHTDHELFNQWIERAWGDLHLLATDTPDGFVPYAGIPWYVAPFGRDSLITALQTSCPSSRTWPAAPCATWRATRRPGTTRSPIRSPARSSTNTGVVSWLRAARSPSCPITERSTPPRSSCCCSVSTCGGREMWRWPASCGRRPSGR